MVDTLYWQDDVVMILDQRKLPAQDHLHRPAGT